MEERRQDEEPWLRLDPVERVHAAQRLLVERFVVPGDTSVPAPDAHDSADGEAESEATGGTGAGAGAEPDVTETVVLVLNGKTTEVPYRAGDTLLETARRAGLQPPFSCEAGNCATCMALLREGSATMRVDNALEPEEVEDGWVLTCQALPHGRTVTVEYESF